MLRELHFHDHPGLEKEHNIPKDHVIIDRGSYSTIRKLIAEEEMIKKYKMKRRKDIDLVNPFLDYIQISLKFIEISCKNIRSLVEYLIGGNNNT